MAYDVKDIKLADKGRLQLSWAEMHMPALLSISSELEKSKPLSGFRIAATLHITKDTGVLMRTLLKAGAKVSLTASNPLSTQDDIAAALALEGAEVYGWKGESMEDYNRNLMKALQIKPNIIMDDGADMHAVAHEKNLKGVIGGTEETTTGVIRLKAMERQGVLKYPIIAVNNAKTKYLFDNRYGTGQSTVDGLLRATNILIAGKCAVVAGYGWVGRGIAMRMKGMGAKTVVTETDPFRALEASMDGFDVMSMPKAAEIGEIFITATGNKNVIPYSCIEKMRNGAILANSGHFDVEVDVKGLEKRAVSKKQVREFMTEYTLKNGRKVYLLAEGRLLNLGAAEGHPSEVMDMSFANQALSAVYIAKNSKKMSNRVYDVFEEIDSRIARLKLDAMGIKIDEPTEEQKKYLDSWGSEPES